MILSCMCRFVQSDSSAAQDQAIKVIENCIADVRAWLVSHRLMFGFKDRIYNHRFVAAII